MLHPVAAVVILSSPLPLPDPCPHVLDLLAGGAAAEQAGARLAGLGAHVVPVVAEALDDRPGPVTAARLIGVLASYRDPRGETSIRPYIFSGEPEMAALATRALFLAGGPRAVPTLEHLLREDRSFEQSLAALEGIARYELPSSFAPVASYAEDAGHDPILRSLAAAILPGLDRRASRRWLERLKLPPGSNPFFAASIDRLLTAERGEQGRSR